MERGLFTSKLRSNYIIDYKLKTFYSEITITSKKV